MYAPPASRTRRARCCAVRSLRARPTMSYPPRANVVAIDAARPAPAPAISAMGRSVLLMAWPLDPAQNAGKDTQLRNPANRERQRAHQRNAGRVDDEVQQTRGEIRGRGRAGDGCGHI